MMDAKLLQELFKLKQDQTVMGPTHNILGTVLNFDGLEGKGQIVVERGSYGAYIWVNGKCLALVDLFTFSPEYKKACDPGDDRDYPQIVFYQPEEDESLGHVRWLPDRTEIFVEWNPLEQVTDAIGTTLTYTLDEEANVQECPVCHEPCIGDMNIADHGMCTDCAHDKMLGLEGTEQ